MPRLAGSRKPSQAGFTLIETLVSIAMFAVLAGLSLYVLTGLATNKRANNETQVYVSAQDFLENARRDWKVYDSCAGGTPCSSHIRTHFAPGTVPNAVDGWTIAVEVYDLELLNSGGVYTIVNNDPAVFTATVDGSPLTPTVAAAPDPAACVKRVVVRYTQDDVSRTFSTDVAQPSNQLNPAALRSCP